MILPVLSGTLTNDINSGIALFLKEQNLFLGTSPILAVFAAVFWTILYVFLAVFVLNKKDIC